MEKQFNFLKSKKPYSLANFKVCEKKKNNSKRTTNEIEDFNHI